MQPQALKRWWATFYLQGRLERLRELFRFLQAEGMEPAAQPADSAV